MQTKRCHKQQRWKSCQNGIIVVVFVWFSGLAFWQICAWIIYLKDYNCERSSERSVFLHRLSMENAIFESQQISYLTVSTGSFAIFIALKWFACSNIFAHHKSRKFNSSEMKIVERKQRITPTVWLIIPDDFEMSIKMGLGMSAFWNASNPAATW